MRPDITGQGRGGSFVRAGLRFLSQKEGIDQFRLVVASFNARAIRVYEKAGFVRTRSLKSRFGELELDFICMEYPRAEITGRENNGAMG